MDAKTNLEKNIESDIDKAPIHPKEFFEEIFREKENFISIQDYQKEIINSTDYLKPFPFKLRIINNGDIKGEKLFDTLRNKSSKFIEALREALYNLVCFDSFVKEKLIAFQISSLAEASEKFPLWIDYNGFEHYLPAIIDHTRDATPYVNKISRFIGRFLSTSLELRIEYEQTFFRCLICGKTFEMPQVDKKFGEPYRVPNSCIDRNCKASKQKDFKLETDKSKSHEIRTFYLGDNDITKTIERKCVILQNIPYFVEVARNINIDEQVEVIGFLRVDSREINNTRKEDYEFSYYIEVISLRKMEDKKLDFDIISDLKSKIQKNPDIVIELINDFYPYTKYLYESFIAKLLIALSWITSNSFRKESSKRNSINVIIGGHTGTIKTSEIENLRRILGPSQIIRLSAQEVTEKGLVPTSSRANNEKDLVLRYGAFRWGSKKLLVLDETQYLTEKNLQQHKCLEEGRIDKATDGSLINAEAEGSVIHLLNYISNENEKYDYSKNLLENLPKAYRAQPSILERLDSHFAMPPISETIIDVLTLRDPYMPVKEFPDIVDLNYLEYAKILYKEFNDKKIDKKMQNKIRDIATILDKTSKIRTPRQRKIIKKYIKGIACLHLRDNIEDYDLEFLKRHLVHTIIPFYDNPAINTLREPDMDRIFQWTLRLLTEIKEEIFIPDHVKLIRECVRNNFFPGKTSESLMTQSNSIDNYMPDTENTRNSRYMSLLEKNEKFIEGLKWMRCQIKTKTAFAKRDDLIKRILNQLTELYQFNEFKEIAISSVKQNLEATIDLDRDTINNILNILKENGTLIEKGNKFIFNAL